jgi:hypothetical protein
MQNGLLARLGCDELAMLPCARERGQHDREKVDGAFLDVLSGNAAPGNVVRRSGVARVIAGESPRVNTQLKLFRPTISAVHQVPTQLPAICCQLLNGLW